MPELSTYSVAHQVAFVAPMVRAAYDMHYLKSEDPIHFDIFTRLAAGFTTKEIWASLCSYESTVFTKVKEIAKVPELRRLMLNALFRRHFGRPVPDLVRLIRAPGDDLRTFEVCCTLLEPDEESHFEQFARVDLLDFFVTLDHERPHQLFASLFE